MAGSDTSACRLALLLALKRRIMLSIFKRLLDSVGLVLLSTTRGVSSARRLLRRLPVDYSAARSGKRASGDWLAVAIVAFIDWNESVCIPARAERS